MKTIRVVAAIIIDDGKVFATQRGYGDFKDGWEFPGGKIETGETPQEALIREIKEELEVEIKVGDLIDTVEYDYPTFHLSMDCFWAEAPAFLRRLRHLPDRPWHGGAVLLRKMIDKYIYVCYDVQVNEHKLFGGHFHEVYD